MFASTLSKPRCVPPPSGRKSLYAAPKPIPRFSVTRFDTSTEKSVSRVAGPSSPAGALMDEIVGNDSSSATKGSSVVRVAGKNRFPAKPCAKAAPVTAADASARADISIDKRFFLIAVSASDTIPSIGNAAGDSETSTSMCGGASGSHLFDPDRYLDRTGVLEPEDQGKFVANLERLPQLAQHHVIAAGLELQRFAGLDFQCRDPSHPHNPRVDFH